MSSNISDLLQKKYDNPSITTGKTSGDLDETEKALVTKSNTDVKEGNTYTKNNKVVKEAITPPIAKKKIYTVNKTEKSQAPNKK